MNTYHNQLYDFEIDFPDGWRTTKGVSRLPVMLSAMIHDADILEEYSDGSQEWVNLSVECMHPEPTPSITELILSVNALKMNYSDLVISRITIAEREHTCGTYIMKHGLWLKKYLIVLNGYGYAITASCPISHRSQLVEERWDCIAKSFRLLHPVNTEVRAFNNSIRVKQYIDLLQSNLEEELESLKKVIYL